MPLTDWTQSFVNEFKLGIAEAENEAEAEELIEELIERSITDASFHMTQIVEYSATYDDIEGFLPLDPEYLTDEAIYESSVDLFQILATLIYYPDLQEVFNTDAINDALAQLEQAQEVVDGIRGDDFARHMVWKDQIVRHFGQAVRDMQSIS